MKAFRLTYYLDKRNIIEIIEHLLTEKQEKYFTKGDCLEDNEVSLVYEYIWNKTIPTKKDCIKHIKHLLYTNEVEFIECTDRDETIKGVAIYIVEKYELYK